jgi:hypothetical protein
VKVGGTEHLYICVKRQRTIIKGLNNRASGVDKKKQANDDYLVCGVHGITNKSNITVGKVD